MLVKFVVPGQPVAKGRPKFARRGAFVTTYTPDTTARYENLVKLAAAHEMAGRAPSERPLSMTVDLQLQIPASWSKKKHAAAVLGNVRATKKPDADNILKGLKDACNGVVWKDDAQVIQIVVEKRYSDTPAATVIVRELEGEAA